MAESGKSTRFEYDDFVLLIGSGEGSTYSVQVIQSPAGISEKEEMKLPFDKTNLQIQDESEIQKIGSELFNALFTGSVQQNFDVSLTQAFGKGKGLRIKLVLTAPDLVTLPWEFLNDSRGDGDKFLCLNPKTPIIRSTKLPATIQPLTIEPPLRILGMIASPTDLPPLNVKLEKERLESSLKDLQEAGLVHLHWVEGQTWHHLDDELLNGTWHIFHFIGHGGFAESRGGFVALCNDLGEQDKQSADQLAGQFLGHESLRLVVLNACEGARGNQENIFSSTASILLRREIPAVVAMQYAISDQAALEFSRSFYKALAAGLPVDAAVVKGRVGISVAIDNSLEWGTPVLFCQNLDGNIFDITPKQPEAAKFVSITPPPSSGTPEPAQAIPDSQPRRTQPAATPIASGFGGSKKIPRIWIASGIIIGIILILLIGGMLIKNALNNKPAIGIIFTETPTLTMTTGFAPSPTPTLAVTTEFTSYMTASPTPAPSSTPTATLTPTASPTPTVTPLPTVITDGQGVKMVLIPGGSFQMGLDPELAYKECLKFDSACNMGRFADEAPVHWVELDSFYMDEKEVTNAQYSDCVEAEQCLLPQETKSSSRASYYDDYLYAEYPVIYVTWNSADSYCKWRGARLPSEAEWEFAARGGLEGKLYPWGDTLPVCVDGKTNGARFNDGKNCKGKDTARVGQFSPNGYGLYDMAGNVWEWAADWYGIDYYRKSPARNPSGPTDGQYKVLRGGGWGVKGYFLRTAVRFTFRPTNANDTVGFRCVLTP